MCHQKKLIKDGKNWAIFGHFWDTFGPFSRLIGPFEGNQVVQRDQLVSTVILIYRLATLTCTWFLANLDDFGRICVQFGLKLVDYRLWNYNYRIRHPMAVKISTHVP